MNIFAIPQTLILPAETSFAEVRKVLETLGFSESESGIVSPPLVEGEPEIANWSWYGQLPVVQYSYNPVIGLRLLEVATVPPELRGEIAQALQPLPAEFVRDALRDKDERHRLYGARAALETERIDLIQEITALRDQTSGLVLDEIDDVLHRLGDLAESRLEMLTSARVIAESAMELIGALRDVDVLQTLLPSREDCAAVFHHSIADAAWEELAAREPPSHGLLAQPESADDITALPAGALRWQNELSEKFVRGYRMIAGWMEPSRIWLGWTGTEPDGGVREMDGLVFVNGHWAWMPKVFRIVEPLTLQPPQAPEGLLH